MATATKGAMVMMTRVAGNKEGDGDSNNVGNGNSNKGGRRVTATRAIAAVTATATTWAMATMTRVAGNIEGNGKGGKGGGDCNKGGRQ
jgi:hypothetical protein